MLSNCTGPALEFLHHEGLVFPPSPESSLTGSNCASDLESPVQTLSNFREIEPIKWVRKEKIGQGAQGSIYRCEEPHTGREVAVKVIWMQDLPPLAVEAVKQEVKTMKRLRHRHLVRYFQATEKKKSELRIYMEYAAGGSLSAHLARSGALPVPLVQRYTRQLCEALHYLHQNGIAHRDVKCANILLTTAADGTGTDVKLADFGTFKIVGCASLVGGLKGTPHWMAPEVIRYQHVDEKEEKPERWFRADVWSLGCAVLEMITGHSPWQQYSNPLTAMYQIVSSEETPTIPSNVPTTVASFLTLCLQRNPEQRGTMTQLLAHPFVCVERDSNSRATTLKRRQKRRGDGRGRIDDNQRALRLTPRKEIASEPELHEDSMTLSSTGSPDRFAKLKVDPPSPVSFQVTKDKSRQSRSLANRRLPSNLRLKSLEGTNQPLDCHDVDAPLSKSPGASKGLPRMSSTLIRGGSAGSTRLPHLVKSGDDLQSVAISPMRSKRSTTAPTTVGQAIDGSVPVSFRLPPLSARFASMCFNVKPKAQVEMRKP